LPPPAQPVTTFAEAVEQARKGDTTALAEVVRKVTPILWQVARQQGLDRWSCEDVVQTAWLRLVRAPEAIRTPEAFVGWLVKVTRREAWRVAAQQSRTNVTDEAGLSELPDQGDGPEATAVLSAQHEVLWQAVGKLQPRCQYMLRLIAYQGRLSNAPVAEALDMPVGAVGPTRGRCLHQLRSLLAADPRWSD
jgi:RNA polymerase sigma factor (sigma-70 family)